MGDVVIAGATEIRQAAGDSQAARIIQGQTQFLAGQLHRGWEAAVDVEGADIFQAAVRHGQGFLAGHPHGGGGIIILTVGNEPVIVGVRAAVQIDPVVLWDTQGLRLGG